MTTRNAWPPEGDEASADLSLSTTKHVPVPRTQEASLPDMGKTLGGKYRIGRLLGRGGMGAVYEVETKEGLAAAAKILSPTQMEPAALERFFREATAACAIDSPHVVKILDLGRDGKFDAPYIVMERLNGLDLATLYARAAPILAIPLLRVFIQAGRGLSAAHQRGIAHRDVKPANIFLHLADDRLVTAKICDFGVAKSFQNEGGHELTQTGGLLGSPFYMSPEQAINAKDVDGRSDIWSLGIALYEGLSGRRPWQQSTSIGQIIVAICTKRVPPLWTVAPWIDARIAAVVDRALEPTRERRWPTMDEMIRALEPFAEGTDVRLDDLKSVPQELRAVAEATSSSSIAKTKARHRARSRRRVLSFLALGIGCLGLGGAIAFLPSREKAAAPAPGLVGVPSASVRGAPSGAIVGAGQVATAGVPPVIQSSTGRPAEPEQASPPPDVPDEAERARKLQPAPAGGRITRPSNTLADPAPLGKNRVSPAGQRPTMGAATCQPPYRIDSAGVRHIKPECL